MRCHSSQSREGISMQGSSKRVPTLRRWAGRHGVAVVCMALAGLPGCGGGGGDPASTEAPVAGAAVLDGVPASFVSNTGASPASGACPMFPAAAVFNTRVDGFKVHPQHSLWMKSLSASTRFHPDWGRQTDPTASDYYGIPYNVVDGQSVSTSWPVLDINGYADESDCAVPNGSGAWRILQGCTPTALGVQSARFPFPPDAQALHESQTGCTDCDSHVLIVEQAQCRLWEAGGAHAQGGRWTAGVGVAWDLRSLAIRPDRWTSADASGMPMTPFIVKVSEANSGEIRHALRVTLGNGVLSGSAFVWPASHWSGSSASGPVPMGAVLRLQSNFVVPANWTTQAKAVAVAMQRYGLYVTDRGSNLFAQGEPSPLWQDATLDQLKTLTAAQFEFVDMSAITGKAGFDARSYAATW